MSYLVLARKSRPGHFDEVVGQEAVVRTLKNALARDRVPHGLIFSGIRGTGKTTLARIMAKALNCEQGPTPDPCGECRSCREIAAGASVDLHEIDGASNRGIQEIRDLKENIRFMPTSSRFKIVIIDEVHMLTTEAFNALLKTLEEPPEHVYFMFATTELHKVPLTILSRCQRYELKRVAADTLSAHFDRLARAEGFSVAPEAMRLIVRESGGSVRDGLSLLDQVFSYCGNEIRASDVEEILGLVSQELIGEIGVGLLAGDLGLVLTAVDRVYGQGMNVKRFAADLLTWFRHLLLCQLNRNPAQVLDLPEDELERLRTVAANHAPAAVSALFTLLLEGLERLQYASQPRMALEAAFIQAIQARDVEPVAELLTRFDRVLAGLPAVEGEQRQTRPRPSAAVASEPVTGAANPAETREAAGQQKTESGPPGAPAPSADSAEARQGPVDRSRSRPEPEMETVPEPEPLPTAASEPRDRDRRESPPQITADNETGTEAGPTEAERSGTEADQSVDVRRHWPAFIDYVHERKPWMAAALKMASSARMEGDRLVIRFDEAVHCKLLKSREHIRPLTEFALDFFQRGLSVAFEVPEGQQCEVDPQGTLGAREQRKALAREPLVLTALEVFSGQIGDIRVGPRFRAPLAEQAAGSEQEPDRENGASPGSDDKTGE